MSRWRFEPPGLRDQLRCDLLNGALPRLDEQKGARLRTIEGLPPDLINPGPECRFSPRCRYVRDICREQEPELSPREEEGHLARCHGTEPGGWIQ